MKPHTRVIQAYQDRFDAAVNRSPLLKATISNASRLLEAILYTDSCTPSAAQYRRCHVLFRAFLINKSLLQLAN